MGNRVNENDLPVISLPTDSTRIEGVPIVNEQKATASGELRKAPPMEARLSPAPTPAPGAVPPRAAAAPQAPADPRKASEIRKPGSVVSHPVRPAPTPAAPLPIAEPAEEDPEKLLRESRERPWRGSSPRRASSSRRPPRATPSSRISRGRSTRRFFRPAWTRKSWASCARRTRRSRPP